MLNPPQMDYASRAMLAQAGALEDIERRRTWHYRLTRIFGRLYRRYYSRMRIGKNKNRALYGAYYGEEAE